MKTKYKILQAVFLAWGLCGVQEFANAQTDSAPKIKVGIFPTEVRWVTTSDGGRVFFGPEITSLLGNEIFTSKSFSPILLNMPGSSSPVALTLQPVVETLVYASGARSNRVVMGFTPEYEDLYNAGRGGAKDNEFIASLDDQSQCRRPDFFGGAFEPAGWGPFRSNFGANIDEGAMINILGYGLGFKQKRYEVKTQIRFIITDTRSGIKQEVVYHTKAKGQDIFVAGAYQGISLGVEIQRRETLMEALKQMTPEIIRDLVAKKFNDVWQTQIVSVGSQIFVDAGVAEGLQFGMELQSDLGSFYKVTVPGEHASVVEKTAGPNAPFVGEVLHHMGTQALQLASSNSVNLLSDGQVQVFEQDININNDQVARARAQTKSIGQCIGKSDWVVDTVEAIFTLYALYRYNHFLDQSIKHPQNNSNLPLVALIDSGFDYNDSELTPYASSTAGFDMVSMDRRPSDDNGHGSAAAKFMVRSVKSKFQLMSVKVIGAYGETSSGTIYEGIKYAASQRPVAIVIPWTPDADHRSAYDDGIALANSFNIPVFMAQPGDGSQEFKATSLGGVQVKLDAIGAKAVSRFAEWFNGGRYVSH